MIAALLSLRALAGPSLSASCYLTAGSQHSRVQVSYWTADRAASVLPETERVPAGGYVVVRVESPYLEGAVTADYDLRVSDPTDRTIRAQGPDLDLPSPPEPGVGWVGIFGVGLREPPTFPLSVTVLRGKAGCSWTVDQAGLVTLVP